MIVKVEDSRKKNLLLDLLCTSACVLCPRQVIEGGDLDVNFVVSDPMRSPLVMEPHSMDGLHAVDVKQTGEYEICLDNTFSRMTGEHLTVVPAVALGTREEKRKKKTKKKEKEKGEMKKTKKKKKRKEKCLLSWPEVTFS